MSPVSWAIQRACVQHLEAPGWAGQTAPSDPGRHQPVVGCSFFFFPGLARSLEAGRAAARKPQTAPAHPLFSEGRSFCLGDTGPRIAMLSPLRALSGLLGRSGTRKEWRQDLTSPTRAAPGLLLSVKKVHGPPPSSPRHSFILAFCASFPSSRNPPQCLCPDATEAPPPRCYWRNVP